MIRVFSQYISPKIIALIALECVISTFALLIGIRLRFWYTPRDFDVYTSVPQFFIQAAMFIGILQVCLYYGDFYDLRAVKRRHEQLFCLGQSLGAACVVLAILYYILPYLLIGRGALLTSMAVVAVSIMSTRMLLDTAWRLAVPVHNVIILGAGDLALKVAREISHRDDLNLSLIGMLAPPSRSSVCGSFLNSTPVLGVTSELEQIVTEHRISKIVVALEDRRGALPIRELVRLRVQGIRVEDAHTTMSALTGRIWLDAVQPGWFVFSNGFRRSTPLLIVKRAIDILFGAAGLILSAPVMLLVALAIRLDSKGPVIYRQTRVGYRGKPFEVLKFRSMRVDAELGTGAQWAQKEDPRVTRLGRLLRKYRLDELPQFANVLRGDMSFVGPRPERPVFVEKLRKQIPYYDERHLVRPGLTGWAQVQYHYGSTMEDALRKLEYDLFYLMNMSPMFDCSIILQTVRILLYGQGSR
jgi:sugar transferase (PEP-CTERM system associated)